MADIPEEESTQPGGHADRNIPQVSQEDKIKLRRRLHVNPFPPIKWKKGKFHIHILSFLIMTIQFANIVLITMQIITFTNTRSTFSSVVNKGHLTLRHLLMKSWDSAREVPPYPPAQGDLAMYEVKDLLEEMNYAVESFYNIENNAIGFYKLYSNSDHDDNVIIRMKYFDFPRIEDLTNELVIKDSEIKVGNDRYLTSTFDSKTNKTIYKYNITESFEAKNLTEPLQRLLSIELLFSFHSVRVYKDTKSALCLFIKGTLSFLDEDNNGQMLVDLVTTTARKQCSDIDISVRDVELQTGSKLIGILIITLCSISLFFGTVSAFFGIYFTCCMAKGFQRTRKDYSFLTWEFILVLSNALTIPGIKYAVFSSWTSDTILSQFDLPAILLSVGGLLSCLYILKIFKVHNNFFILFKVLWKAFFPMIAYLICIAGLFYGFFLCGYVVLGPYHVKFASVSATIETMFSIGNGDDIFATFANVEDKKSGTKLIFWFSRLYICAYVSIFTVVVLNILIAIFVGAQDIIKDKRQKRNENPQFVLLEKALYNLLTKENDAQSLNLKSTLFGAPDDAGYVSEELMKVKAELEKVWKITGEGNLMKISKLEEQQTLKSFINGDDQDISDGCCCKVAPYKCCGYRWFCLCCAA